MHSFTPLQRLPAAQTLSSLQLAPPLEVKLAGRTYTYDDLDELVAKFVDPVAAGLRALGAHRKWVGAQPWGALQARLAGQRGLGGPLPWLFAADADAPGVFYLALALPAGDRAAAPPAPQRVKFPVVPAGFYVGNGKVYDSLDRMTGDMKRDARSFLRRAKEQKAKAGGAAAPAAAAAAQQ